MSFGENGTLSCTGEILEGAWLQLMIGNRELAMAAAHRAAQQAIRSLNRIACVIVFDSIVRRTLLGSRHAAAEIDRIRELAKRGEGIVARTGEFNEFCAFGREPARLARIGEEGYRRRSTDKHDPCQALENVRGHFTEIGQALDRNASGTSLQACREGLADQSRAGYHRDPAGLVESIFAKCPATKKQGNSTIPSQGRGGRVQQPVIDLRRLRDRPWCGYLAIISPGMVGGHD